MELWVKVPNLSWIAFQSLVLYSNRIVIQDITTINIFNLLPPVYRNNLYNHNSSSQINTLGTEPERGPWLRASRRVRSRSGAGGRGERRVCRRRSAGPRRAGRLERNFANWPLRTEPNWAAPDTLIERWVLAGQRSAARPIPSTCTAQTGPVVVWGRIVASIWQFSGTNLSRKKGHRNSALGASNLWSPLLLATARG